MLKKTYLRTCIDPWMICFDFCSGIFKLLLSAFVFLLLFNYIEPLFFISCFPSSYPSFRIIYRIQNYIIFWSYINLFIDVTNLYNIGVSTKILRQILNLGKFSPKLKKSTYKNGDNFWTTSHILKINISKDSPKSRPYR